MAASTTNKRMVTGLFRDRDSAEQAYRSVAARGYSSDDVNLVMSDETRKRHFSDSGPAETELSAGGYRLDLRSRRVTVHGREVDLSAREFRLLEIFMGNPGQVLSREQLLDHAWGFDFDPGSNVVDVYVGYLRRKLGAEAITTVRGMGYRFRP